MKYVKRHDGDFVVQNVIYSLKKFFQKAAAIQCQEDNNDRNGLKSGEKAQQGGFGLALLKYKFNETTKSKKVKRGKRRVCIFISKSTRKL